MFLTLWPFSIPPPQPVTRQRLAQTVVLDGGIFRLRDLSVEQIIAHLDRQDNVVLNLQKAVQNCIEIVATSLSKPFWRKFSAAWG